MKIDKNILVLEGGFNEEHEVSLATSQEVKKSLHNLEIKYESLIVNPDSFNKDIDKFDNNNICFNALHGSFGEDGQIQKILDKKSFKYTHSNSESSFLGFNKSLTKNEIEDINISYPKYMNLNFKDLNESSLKNFMSNFGEFIIKPNSSGSSFGVKVLKNDKDIDFFLNNLRTKNEIYKNHSNLILEEYLKGRELTVAVIEKDGQSIPIEVTEIIFDNDKYFDYDSKYTPGASTHILPANLNEFHYKTCKNIAKIVHDKIKCRGLSRSDFILSNNQIFFLEINTQPGLTPVSLLPEQLKYQNISFNDLILNTISCCK